MEIKLGMTYRFLNNLGLHWDPINGDSDAMKFALCICMRVFSVFPFSEWHLQRCEMFLT
jgi:hypothetical protein